MTDLPDGWEWSTVGAITLPVAKVDPRAEPAIEFSYIDIGGIDGDTGAIRETQRLQGADAPSRARQQVRAGDTVLSTVRTYMRKTALVPADLDWQVASTGFAVLRPARGVHPRYLFHAVRSQGFVEALSMLQTGSSYPAVRDRDVRSMPVPLAPALEQERIVSAIDDHLSRVEAGEQAARPSTTRVGALRKVIISEVLKRGDWPTVCWGDVGETLSGRAFPSRDYCDEGIRLLRPGNLDGSGRVTWRPKATTHLPHHYVSDAAKYVLEGRNLLMNLTAQSLADDFLGRVCLSNDDDRFLLNQRIARLSSEVASSDYLYWVFRSRAFRSYVASLNSGSLIQHISTKQLAMFRFPLPPYALQSSLVEDIASAVHAADRLEAAVDLVRQRSSVLRRSILAAAFAGRLVPQDATDEPASVLLERIRVERAAASPTKRTRKAKSA